MSANTSPSGDTPPTKALPELAKRVLSGGVLMVVALITTWTGGLVLVVAFSILGFFVLSEWESLTRSGSQRRLLIGMIVVATAAAAAHLLGPVAGMAAAVTLLFVASGAALFQSHLRWTISGIAYAAWLVISLISLRGHDAVGLSAILFVFAAVWSTDTAAYFGGRAFGGPKLLPSVSPNKTWSGAICGVLAAMLVCLGYITWANGDVVGLPNMRTDGVLGMVLVMVTALILSVAAQAGDLFESGLKRRFGVKDSGSLLPGHGGIMDRVDGLVFASAAAFLIGMSAKGSGSVAEGLLTLSLGS